MALVPFYRFPIVDPLFDPFFFDTLDFYDPWFGYDIIPMFPPVARSFRWTKEHERTTYKSTYTSNTMKTIELTPPPPPPPPPEKFRAQLNVEGFKPESITTKVEGRKLIVEAKHEDRQSADDYHIRELHKAFELPEHAGK